MILSDTTLKSLLKDQSLIVEPLVENSIQPGSIDCRLGTHFLKMKASTSKITLDTPIDYEEFEGDKVIIEPQTFLLATTMEYVKLPNDITAFVEGRSSIGRMGLFIENAGWVDAGFAGRITLELYNANSRPIELDAGRRVCQLVFCKMDQPAEKPYQGKYVGQMKSVGSRVFKDSEVNNG